MEEIGKLLANPAFWPVAAAWTVALGILSTYFKEWIDRGRAWLPERLRRQSEAARLRIDSKIEWIKLAPGRNLQIAVGVCATHRIRGYGFTAASFFFGLIVWLGKGFLPAFDRTATMSMTDAVAVGVCLFSTSFCLALFLVGRSFCETADEWGKAARECMPDMPK